MRTVGLFFTHVRSSRIDRHFERLVRESGHLVEWHLVFNEGRQPNPHVDFACAAPQDCMPVRHQEMMRQGDVPNGFMDLVIMPCALGLDAEFTWVMEYDVDFSGHWATFFGQFGGNSADLLTSTIFPWAHSPSWFFWRTARAPSTVRREQGHRAFHPLMRMSRLFGRRYQQAMTDPQWGGHYEFTLPTVALTAGLQLEDMGGHGPFCPPERKGKNYHSSVEDGSPHPGTFVWRPSRPHYVLERPEAFPEADTLYHPIKADVAEWDKTPSP